MSATSQNQEIKKEIEVSEIGESRIDRILRRIVEYLVTHHQPERIILFGSRAKKTAHRGSDIDLAMEGVGLMDTRTERKLKEALDQLAGIYSVDLIFLEQTDPGFKRLVEESGKVLYEKD